MPPFKKDIPDLYKILGYTFNLLKSPNQYKYVFYLGKKVTSTFPSIYQWM